MKTYLHLEDGTRIAGQSFGWAGESDGEVVFTTGMTGYPQSLTDPSFAGQILTFTYPLVGNYGVPRYERFAKNVALNFESERIWAKGVVVAEHCETPSHYQSVRTLSNWLYEARVPGVAGVDTRQLTLKLREKGVMRGILSPKSDVVFPKPHEDDWVPRVSCSDSISYNTKSPGPHVVLIDCGVKHAILRALLARRYRVTRIPWDGNPLDIGNVDAVVVSNGPGDPKRCRKTVHTVRKLLGAGIPYLGVCLGHQILALAIGADTYKLAYGHRGLNQPCQDLRSGKAYVTSQNHGYAVRPDSIPKEYSQWFVNLNDGTNEGLIHKSKFIRSVQFHPEGYPGPSDTAWIFDFLKGR